MEMVPTANTKLLRAVCSGMCYNSTKVVNWTLFVQ